MTGTVSGSGIREPGSLEICLHLVAILTPPLSQFGKCQGMFCLFSTSRFLTSVSARWTEEIQLERHDDFEEQTFDC